MILQEFAKSEVGVEIYIVLALRCNVLMDPWREVVMLCCATAVDLCRLYEM